MKLSFIALVCMGLWGCGPPVSKCTSKDGRADRSNPACYSCGPPLDIGPGELETVDAEALYKKRYYGKWVGWQRQDLDTRFFIFEDTIFELPANKIERDKFFCSYKRPGQINAFVTIQVLWPGFEGRNKENSSALPHPIIRDKEFDVFGQTSRRIDVIVSRTNRLLDTSHDPFRKLDPQVILDNYFYGRLGVKNDLSKPGVWTDEQIKRRLNSGKLDSNFVDDAGRDMDGTSLIVDGMDLMGVIDEPVSSRPRGETRPIEPGEWGIGKIFYREPVEAFPAQMRCYHISTVGNPRCELNFVYNQDVWIKARFTSSMKGEWKAMRRTIVSYLNSNQREGPETLRPLND